MKKYLYLAVLAAGMLACDNAAKKVADAGESSAPATEATPSSAQAVSNNKEMAAFKFDQSEFDFGTVKEGEVVEHVFKFTNAGTAPLVIQNAVGSCGCTVPEWPKEPIAPNASGEIRVKFDSRGKVGANNKTVTITANTSAEPTVLTLKGNVNADEVSAMQGPVR
jgi:hypothetical protein